MVGDEHVLVFFKEGVKIFNGQGEEQGFLQGKFDRGKGGHEGTVILEQKDGSLVWWNYTSGETVAAPLDQINLDLSSQDRAVPP